MNIIAHTYNLFSWVQNHQTFTLQLFFFFNFILLLLNIHTRMHITAIFQSVYSLYVYVYVYSVHKIILFYYVASWVRHITIYVVCATRRVLLSCCYMWLPYGLISHSCSDFISSRTVKQIRRFRRNIHKK